MTGPFRTVLGVAAWIAFAANSFVPGLLHRCDAMQPAVGGAMAECAHMHGAGGSAARPMAHHPERPAPCPTGDCHCIGHSCCSLGVALPAGSLALTAPAGTAVPAPPTARPTAPILRPSHLLPFAQAPPLQA
jgi:hypothetical protein